MEDPNASTSKEEHVEAEATDIATKFRKSLQELKDFSSQLYHAADYCETTFLNANQKASVLGNTKEYICRAVVTVIDHLGSISANLECHLSKSNTIPETELRIDSLKQRLVTCQHYTHKVSLMRFYWTADFSRNHRRYIAPPLPYKSVGINEVSRDAFTGFNSKNAKKHEFETEEEMPLFLYTYNRKPPLIENSSITKEAVSGTVVMPVRDSLSILPQTEHSHFQFQEARKTKRNVLYRKMMHNKDITSLIRRGKRILT